MHQAVTAFHCTLSEQCIGRWWSFYALSIFRDVFLTRRSSTNGAFPPFIPCTANTDRRKQHSKRAINRTNQQVAIFPFA
jgi:hypothetical protein